MKKFLYVFLCCVLTVGLLACAKQGATSPATDSGNSIPEGLYIGYGQAQITPPLGTPLGGYGQVENRLAESILDHLYSTCLAFRDGGDIYLLYNIDALRTEEEWANELRNRVSKATGVKSENIMVMSTHSHSTPEHRNATARQMCWELYMDGGVKAAENAIADLAPATMSLGSTKIDKLNFVRHYLMNDGTYFGDNFGSTASGYKDYATEVDNELRVVKIVRPDKTDVVICNWGAHGEITSGATKYDMSADYIGATRAYLKNTTGMDMFFILGAAGNQNSRTNMRKDQPNPDLNTYAERLTAGILTALETATPIGGSGVEILQKDVVYEVQRGSADPDVLVKAQEVVSVWNAQTRDAGNALARQYGFHSVYHASAIISNAKRTLSEDTIQLFVTRIGDLAIIHAPYEMFSNNSIFIKENSAFGVNTLIATMSNKGWGYFPTAEAYGYGCYESFGAYFVSGVAEDVADAYLEMLAELKQ